MSTQEEVATVAGQIIAKGERTWLVRWFEGREGGRRKYRSHTVHGTKKDAQAYLNGVLRDRDLGTYVPPTRETLDEFLDRWMSNTHKQRVAATTYRKDEGLLKRYIRPTLGAKRLAALSPADLQDRYAELGERLSPKTIRDAHTLLAAALRQAVNWNMLARNPADAVDVPRVRRAEMHALDGAQARALLKAADGNALHPILTLALDTGARPEEYLGLGWEDFDQKRGAVTIRRALIHRTGGGWYFADTKTAASRRTIEVSAGTVAVLVAHRKVQATYMMRRRDRWQDNGLIFCSRDGVPLNYRNLQPRFKDLLAAAGLPKEVRLYDMRHTCATLLLAAGVNPKVVAERLGHTGMTTLLRTYAHVLPGMQATAADRMGAFLHGATVAPERTGTPEAHSAIIDDAASS